MIQSIEFDLYEDDGWKGEAFLLQPSKRKYRISYAHTLCHISAFTRDTLLEIRQDINKLIGKEKGAIYQIQVYLYENWIDVGEPIKG